MSTQHDVLIGAQRVYLTHMRDDVKVTPTTSNISTGQVLMVMNVDYVFPVGGLVLQSVVPRDKEVQALGILRKRSEMKETA